jgi:hypothetical protein
MPTVTSIRPKAAVAIQPQAQNSRTLPPLAGQLVQEPIVAPHPSLAIAQTSSIHQTEPALQSLKRKAEDTLEATPKRQRLQDSRPTWQRVATNGASPSRKTALDGSAELLNAFCGSTPLFAGTNAISVTMNALSGHAPLAAERIISTDRQHPMMRDEETVDEAACMEKVASLFPYDLTGHRLDKGKNYIDLISRIVREVSSGKTPVGTDQIKFVVKFGLKSINSLHRHYVNKGNMKSVDRLAAHLVNAASRQPVFSEALKAHYLSASEPPLAQLDIAKKLKKSWGL